MSTAKRVYISMIRGINVGGHKRLKMETLRELYAELGFESVFTYVQSGNVAFTSTLDDPGEIAKAIEDGIQSSVGYSVSVVVRTPAELDRVVSETPFPRECEEDPKRTFVTFLAERPHISADTLTVPEGSPERLVAGEREIYVHCPDGAGNSKLSINFFEKALGVRATARNWRTVLALRELAAKAADAET